MLLLLQLSEFPAVTSAKSAMNIRPIPILIFLALATGSGCGREAPLQPDPSQPDTPGIAAIYPLGALRVTDAGIPSCPRGHDCQAIEVTCSGVTNAAPAFVAVAHARGKPRGVVLWTRGGSGMGWVVEEDDRLALLEELRARGLTIVQLRWGTNWLESSPGNNAGTARLGCRPATVVKWVHETYFRPLGIVRSGDGTCGYCITGNSGGASQVSYPLTHYGLSSIVDAALPTGGPPHAALTKACLQRAGEEAYGYPDGTRHFIDRGFGFFDKTGPCFRRDSSFAMNWDRAAIATGGGTYDYDSTRVHFLIGARDLGMQAPAADFIARLRTAGTVRVVLELVPNTSHDILDTSVGRDMLRAALLGPR